jgi:hypothetical protein
LWRKTTPLSRTSGLIQTSRSSMLTSPKPKSGKLQRFSLMLSKLQSTLRTRSQIQLGSYLRSRLRPSHRTPSLKLRYAPQLLLHLTLKSL